MKIHEELLKILHQNLDIIDNKVRQNPEHLASFLQTMVDIENNNKPWGNALKDLAYKHPELYTIDDDGTETGASITKLILLLHGELPVIQKYYEGNIFDYCELLGDKVIDELQARYSQYLTWNKEQKKLYFASEVLDMEISNNSVSLSGSNNGITNDDNIE